MQPLKRQNLPRIILYTVAHAVAFAWVIEGGAFPVDWQDRIAAGFNSAARSGLVAIGYVIFSGLLGDWLKAFLVTWRPKHPLPGCRAFTEIGPSDRRVDMDAIRSKHSPLPKDPNQQNKLWYKIYKQHRDDPAVADAHGNYLLTRELAALTLLFAAIFPTVAFTLGTKMSVAAPYCGSIVGIYAAVAFAGQYYGRRLVGTALALETAS